MMQRDVNETVHGTNCIPSNQLQLPFRTIILYSHGFSLAWSNGARRGRGGGWGYGVAGLRGCGVAGLRGCGVAGLRGCGVAGLRGCGVAGLRSCGVGEGGGARSLVLPPCWLLPF